MSGAEISKPARCPECGGRCVLRIVRNPEGEVTRASAECEKCGSIPVLYKVLPTGDRRLVLAGGEEYEPSEEVYQLKQKASSSEGKERLLALLDAAEFLRKDEREREAVSICLEAEEEALKQDPLSDEFRDLAVKAACVAGEIMNWDGDDRAAKQIFDEMLAHAEESSSPEAVRLRIDRAFCLYRPGEEGPATAALREMADEADKEGGLTFRGSHLSAARIYGALNTLYMAKRDHDAAYRAERKAVKCAEALMAEEPSEQGAELLVHSLQMCAAAAYASGNKAKGKEYAKRMAKVGQSYKDTYRSAYIDSLLLTGMLAADSEEALIPDARKSTEEAISVLSVPDGNGFIDERLALAYFYHSMKEDSDELDPDDMDRAYKVLRDNAYSGRIARDVFSQVGNSYLVYLQGRDPKKADEVRAEMRAMGLFRSLREEGYDPDEIRKQNAEKRLPESKKTG